MLGPRLIGSAFRAWLFVIIVGLVSRVYYFCYSDWCFHLECYICSHTQLVGHIPELQVHCRDFATAVGAPL
jgi:hypothetical protein